VVTKSFGIYGMTETSHNFQDAQKIVSSCRAKHISKYDLCLRCNEKVAEQCVVPFEASTPVGST
jgi:hypothetical protein